MSAGDASRIAALNDAMRRAGPQGPGGNRWVMTRGVMNLGAAFALRAAQAVTAFDAFTTDNDPYGERDFGSFEIGGQRLFWKIDCYDLTLEHGSPDPADPSVTRRVLTIMLANEY